MTSSQAGGSDSASTNANSSTKGSSTKLAKKFGFMDKMKLFLIVVLLVVLAGAGGYFYGTQQNFISLQKVNGAGNSGSQPGGAAGNASTGASTSQQPNSQPANQSSSQSSNQPANQANLTVPDSLKNNAATSVTASAQSSGLRNKYWINLLSGDAAMLSMTVNGALVSLSSNPIDISSNVRPGENHLVVDIRPPVGSSKSVDLQVLCGNTVIATPTPNEATVLLKYFKTPGARQSSENLSFTDRG